MPISLCLPTARRTQWRRLFFGTALVLIGAVAWAGTARSNSIYDFVGTGRDPGGGLTLGPNGELYGTTGDSPGSAQQAGTIFKITADGTFTTLYRLNGGSDGAYPEGPLLYDADGCFYGATSKADYTGDNGGTVFRFNPANNQFTVLANLPGQGTTFDQFEKSEFGASFPLVRGSDGALYGVAYAETNGLEIFRVTAANAFENVANLRIPALLIHQQASGAFLAAGPDGHIYGMAGLGGNYTEGMIFRLEDDGSVTDLLDFNGETGPSYPVGQLLLGPDGDFYGCAASGGAAGEGCIFRISPAGSFTTIFDFPPEDQGMGALPATGLTLGPDGNLYGVTLRGGVETTLGVAFRIGLDGSDYTVLTSDYEQTPDGLSKLTPDADGNLYGTTPDGSFAADEATRAEQVYDSVAGGTVYRISPDGTFTTLHSFDRPIAVDVEARVRANAGLTFGTDGNLYGTVSGSGDLADGYVFRLTPDGAFSVLSEFHGPDGALPTTGLLQASDGKLYGVTAQGGYGGGTVFRVDLAGALTTLYNFDGATSGDDPEATLIQGLDGEIYGTTSHGGPNGSGTVFRLDPASGQVTTMVSLPAAIDGDGSAYSNPGVAYGADGNLYGVTTDGGASNAGMAYRLTSAGVLTDVFDFTGATGAYPRAALLRGVDGAFYGTTSAGGPGGAGDVYRLTTDGQFKILGDYAGTVDAYQGDPTLVQEPDGTLYGVDQNGAFSLAPDGTRTTLARLFTDSATVAPLTLAPDGSFYATTLDGGSGGYGQVFHLLATGANVVTLTATTATTSTATGSSPGVVTVSRDPAGDLSAPLTVYYDIGGSAMNGLDYQTLSGSRVIPIGKASVKIKVKPLEGSDRPAGTHCSVRFTLAEGEGYTVGTTTPVRVKIQEAP